MPLDSFFQPLPPFPDIGEGARSFGRDAASAANLQNVQGLQEFLAPYREVQIQTADGTTVTVLAKNETPGDALIPFYAKIESINGDNATVTIYPGWGVYTSFDNSSLPDKMGQPFTIEAGSVTAQVGDIIYLKKTYGEANLQFLGNDGSENTLDVIVGEDAIPVTNHVTLDYNITGNSVVAYEALNADPVSTTTDFYWPIAQMLTGFTLKQIFHGGVIYFPTTVVPHIANP